MPVDPAHLPERFGLLVADRARRGRDRRRARTARRQLDAQLGRGARLRSRLPHRRPRSGGCTSTSSTRTRRVADGANESCSGLIVHLRALLRSPRASPRSASGVKLTIFSVQPGPRYDDIGWIAAAGRALSHGRGSPRSNSSTPPMLLDADVWHAPRDGGPRAGAGRALAVVLSPRADRLAAGRGARRAGAGRARGPRTAHAAGGGPTSRPARPGRARARARGRRAATRSGHGAPICSATISRWRSATSVDRARRRARRSGPRPAARRGRRGCRRRPRRPRRRRRARASRRAAAAAAAGRRRCRCRRGGTRPSVISAPTILPRRRVDRDGEAEADAGDGGVDARRPRPGRRRARRRSCPG